jgi:hypothetical protein
LYIIFDLVILALTALLVVSLARIPRRHKRLAQRGIASRSGLAWRSALIAVSHFSWPLLILYLALTVRVWRVYVMYQPDLGYWLQAVAAVVFLKGLLEIALIRSVYRRTERRWSQSEVHSRI